MVDPVVEQLLRDEGLSEALSPDGGYITIAGYASLMDEASARETTPSHRNFRYGVVRDHCRVFTLVSIINVRRRLARGKHLATATARPRGGSELLCCLFDVPVAELPALLAREYRLRWSCVRYDHDSGGGGGGGGGGGSSALMFTEFSDAEYMRERCKGDTATYEESVGQYYTGRLYRDDIFPVPSYVLRCIRAMRLAANPDAMRANLLDSSFLGDGETTLRTHLDEVVAKADGASAAGWLAEERGELLELLEGAR